MIKHTYSHRLQRATATLPIRKTHLVCVAQTNVGYRRAVLYLFAELWQIYPPIWIHIHNGRDRKSLTRDPLGLCVDCVNRFTIAFMRHQFHRHWYTCVKTCAQSCCAHTLSRARAHTQKHKLTSSQSKIFNIYCTSLSIESMDDFHIDAFHSVSVAFLSIWISWKRIFLFLLFFLNFFRNAIVIAHKLHTNCPFRDVVHAVRIGDRVSQKRSLVCASWR